MGIKKVYQTMVLLASFFFFTADSCLAQKDSLILVNGNIIVGKIKNLNGGVLTIETDYSKNDFTVKWAGINEIYSDRSFLIGLENGQRGDGVFRFNKTARTINLRTREGTNIEAPMSTVIFIKEMESSFWSRMKAGVDLGLSIAKANNLKQLTINSKLGYLADKWESDAYYNVIRASQDSIEPTKRTDAGVSFKYYLSHNWFLSASTSFLSNTEQALKLRFVGKLGGGKFFIHTNKTYWGAGAGLSFNKESFTNTTPSRNSLEGFMGTDLNLFDIGDFSLASSLFVYPSFTESGRWRSDFRIDTKYDLPLDIYLKLNLTMNYDNRPAVAGKEVDYLFGFSIGWSL